MTIGAHRTGFLLIPVAAMAVALSGCGGRTGGQATPGNDDRPTDVSYRVTATVPVGKGPNGIAVDPGTRAVYVANTEDGSVSVIDGETRAVTSRIPVGNKPWSVAVDPSTNTIFVTHLFDNTVSVIDGSTRAVTATVAVGRLPVDVAVDPNTHLVYVPNARDETLSVIDGTTSTVVATVRVGANPQGVAVDPALNTFYVITERFAGGNQPATGANLVSVIDASTRTVTHTIPAGTGPRGVAVDTREHVVYVANFWESTVSMIDARPRAVVAAVPVQSISASGALAVDPGTRTAYVVNERGDSVAVIDGSARAVSDTVPVGPGTRGVAVDPGTHTVYVTNSDAGTVSVIETRS